MHGDTVAINLEVALVWVYDDVEILVRTKNLCYHIAEALFEHAHKSSTVDMFRLVELSKGIDHAYGLIFCCHFMYYFCLYSLNKQPLRT